MAAKNKIVGVRFGLTDYRDLCAAAEAAGTTPSAYLRAAYERAREADGEAQALGEMEERIAKIVRGAARRQLGAVLHFVGGKPPAEAKELASKMIGGDA